MLKLKEAVISDTALREGLIVDWMLRQCLIVDRFSLQSSVRQRTVKESSPASSASTCQGPAGLPAQPLTPLRAVKACSITTGEGRQLLWAARDAWHTCGQPSTSAP